MNGATIENVRTRDAWIGRVGFILATIGSAVGIGSIWKFPSEAAWNGGSAFALSYLLGLVLIVGPLLSIGIAAATVAALA